MKSKPKNTINLDNKFLQFLEITLGVVCLAVAFYFFFLPTNLVTGGVTGLSIIFKNLVDPALFLLIGNLVCLVLGLIFLGKEFFTKTIYGTLLLPLLTFILENTCSTDLILKDVENNVSKIIISVVIGGFLAASGLGLCFRNNATTGGIDVIQKIINKYFKLPYSACVYATDAIIILIGFFSLKLELTFYGLITIVFIGYLVDIISVGGKITRTAYIITKYPEEIKNTIYKNLNRGVTFNNVVGGYSGDGYTMVICTLSKRESYRLRELIVNIDEHAFTFFAQTKEVIGDGF